MMKIASMTSAFRDRREGGNDIPYTEAVERCKAAGFDILDLNLCSMIKPDRNEFCGDDWEEKLLDLIAAKEKFQVEFYQTHPPFLSRRYLNEKDEIDNRYIIAMTKRALEITARIGAKWAVLHPICGAPELCMEKQIELNHQVYGEVVELAEKLGIGVAFENLGQYQDKPWWFGCNASELIALADSFNSSSVGICWDFGHANISQLNQPEELRRIGKRLKAVHVTDNRGTTDDHFIPFQGNIRWEEIMPVLVEIDFPGHLVLEVSLTNHMPDELKDAGARLSAEADRQLLKMAYGH